VKAPRRLVGPGYAGDGVRSVASRMSPTSYVRSISNSDLLGGKGKKPAEFLSVHPIALDRSTRPSIMAHSSAGSIGLER
jgi:hypothetical protein